MPSNWSKGYTKHTHPSVLKISETMRRKKIDNFKRWRSEQFSIRNSKYQKELLKNGDLAELIGMVLGDGSIHIYERTEGLRIVLPAAKPCLVQRYAELVEAVFQKKPSVIPRKQTRCVDIRLYQKNISARLGVPAGARKALTLTQPPWITQNTDFMIRYLRGLYEAEGSFSVHSATYTHKFVFANRNQSLLLIVFRSLEKLGFHPHRTMYSVQLSKKAEVYRALELLQFRK